MRYPRTMLLAVRISKKKSLFLKIETLSKFALFACFRFDKKHLSLSRRPFLSPASSALNSVAYRPACSLHTHEKKHTYTYIARATDSPCREVSPSVTYLHTPTHAPTRIFSSFDATSSPRCEEN